MQETRIGRARRPPDSQPNEQKNPAAVTSSQSRFTLRSGSTYSGVPSSTPGNFARTCLAQIDITRSRSGG